MKTKYFCISSMLFKIFFLSSYLLLLLHHSQAEPNTTGYTCPSSNQTTYPCQTYAFYRASAPNFLDLASIADLFSVSRLMISKPSNISSPYSPLIPNQSLFVPLTCSCNNIMNTTTTSTQNSSTSSSISYANITYTIKGGDTFYLVSTNNFQNLTTYQSVEVVNPTLVPTNLSIGENVVFPIFCKCPNTSLLQNDSNNQEAINYLISYVYQPSDTLASLASQFGSTTQSLIDINGNNTPPFDTIFIPVTRLPQLSQPNVSSVAPKQGEDNKGAVMGLAIGLGLCGFLLILVIGLWSYRETLVKKGKGGKNNQEDEEKQEKGLLGKGGQMGLKHMEVNLMADVSDCLDKYRVFKIHELERATDGFDQNFLIQGSVYKACIDEEVYAIKRMKWNACEELKILQKVNHGNLVKLEGFCIDPEDGTCYLIYEYFENGSLHGWLHRNEHNNNQRLDWKTRLRIAIDVANGLQYIHEHTRPRVVHKDIKTSNILLDGNMRAKIANFGLAKSGCNAITMHIVGTQGYIAPEYLADGVVSTKMDVFSFGVVLLELVSGKDAVDEEGKVLWASVGGILEGKEEQRRKRLMGFMDEVLVDSEDSWSMDSLVNVMNVAIACLNRDPMKRPSMVDIVYALCKSDDLFFDVSEDGLSAPLVMARPQTFVRSLARVPNSREPMGESIGLLQQLTSNYLSILGSDVKSSLIQSVGKSLTRK